MKTELAVAAHFAVALCFGCVDLPSVEDGACGNLVLDKDEDCDHFSQFGAATACAEPGSATECHYVCDSAEGILCPEGWGCGADGQCRRPAGWYEPTFEALQRFAVKDFAIGDVDGDGYADLVGNEPTAISIRFGNGDGTFPSDLDTLIRVSTGPLSFGHFDEGDLLDVAVPNVGGLFVLLGQSERTLEPVAYSPFEIEEDGVATIIAVESSPANLSTEMLLLAEDTESGISFMWFIDSTATGVAFPGVYPIHDLAGEVPVENLDRDVEMRSEFALAFKGSPWVWIFTSEGSAGQGGVSLQPVLYQQIGVPGQVLDGARFADVDGNGTQDLMISVRDSLGDPRVAVAYTNGAGVVSDPVIESVFDRGAASPWPIAAANLGGDGKADYVYPEAIYIADLGGASIIGPPQTLTATAFTAGMPWHEAVIADFNGDDLPDVATSVEGWDGLEFMIHGGSVFFNRFFRDTQDPPAMLSVGDYDGDRISDVAFAELGFGGKPDGLSVVFGSTSGGPSEPVKMGQLGYVESVQPVASVPSFESIDMITDLVVVSQAFKDPGARRVAVLQGSSSRRMISPFTLQPDATDSPDVPRRVLFGDFDDDDIRDILAVAEVAIEVTVNGADDETLKRPHHLWFVPGEIGDGSLNSGRAGFTDLPAYTTFDSGCSAWAAGDLDNTAGHYELVAIDNNVDCYGAGDSPAPRLLLGRTSAEAGKPFEVSIVDVPGAYRAVRDLAFHDLDGDGDLDLLALFMGEVRLADTGHVEGAAVVVFWNEDGILAPAESSALEIPGVEYLYDVEPLEQDDDLVPELAVLTDEGVMLARLDPSTREYQLETEPIAGRAGGGRLEIGDLDGDGLDDLAITFASEVEIFLGQPRGVLGAEISE